MVIFFRVHIYRKGSESRGEIGEANASGFPDAALRNDEVLLQEFQIKGLRGIKKRGRQWLDRQDSPR